jgi:outer membrane protein assembly factor BamA
LVFAALVFNACSPKKYLADDENLLISNTVVCDEPSIDIAEPQGYIKQIPVSTILGIALKARIYNSVNPGKADSLRSVNEKKLEDKNRSIRDRYKDKELFLKDTIKKCNHAASYYKKYGVEDSLKYWSLAAEKFDKKLKKHVEKGYEEKTKLFSFPLFLQNIGEEPVKYKKVSTKKSAEQIELYMKTKGYYDAKVSYTEKVKKQQVYVTYNITAGRPIKISRVSYRFEKEDDTLKKYFFEDTAKCLLKAGDNLDIDVLQAERSRITNNLKCKGYYRFSSEYVNYTIDTVSQSYLADVTIEILPVTLDNGKTVKHYRSFISQITVFPNYDNKAALQDRDVYMSEMDTTYIKAKMLPSAVLFVSKEPCVVKKYMILKEIFIRGGECYNQQKVNNTYRHLSAFNIYKLVNIDFEPTSYRDSLNCNIYLTNNALQTYSYEIGGTNSSGNLGALSSFLYQHKNIFHGAESFDLRLSMALESQNNFSHEQNRFGLNTQEYALDTRIYFPRFLAPKKIRVWVIHNTPKSYFSLGVNYRKRPDYTRSAITGSFYYQWNIGKYCTNTVTPVRLSSIRISDADSAFMAWLDRLYIKDSYQDHFILGSSYSFTFNNQSRGRRMYNYLKVSLSWAGNLLHFIDRKTGAEKNSAGVYTVPFLGTVYAQFVKTDIDFRHYIKTIGTNTVVFRAYAGLGIPYGNSSVMPFTEQYFSGGANSLRAWQIRSLGPGSYVNRAPEGLLTKYPNMTSDMKLEANLEYRFKIFWVVEGAWFFDAGNIWSINKDDKRDGGDFSFKRFYKEIAFGTGLGLRLDFDFFIFRTDFGLKLYDPALPEDKRWVVQNDKKFIFNSSNWAFNIGIGYPF